MSAKTSTSDPGAGTVRPAKRHAAALRPYAGQKRPDPQAEERRDVARSHLGARAA